MQRQKAVFDNLCKKLGSSVPKPFQSGGAKVWKTRVYELWNDHLDALSASGKWAIKPLLDCEAIPWDGVEVPTPEAALETAVAAFRARAVNAAAGAGEHSVPLGWFKQNIPSRGWHLSPS